jgi:hypothetical protein
MTRLPMRLECTVWDCCSVACNAGIDTCVLQDEAVWDYAMSCSQNSYLYRTNNVLMSAKIQEYTAQKRLAPQEHKLAASLEDARSCTQAET